MKPEYPIVTIDDVEDGQEYRLSPDCRWSVKGSPEAYYVHPSDWVEVRDRKVRYEVVYSKLYWIVRHHIDGDVAYFITRFWGTAKAKELAEELAAKLNEEQP